MKLGVVRDRHLNPWDAGNYAGVMDHGVELYLCGTGDGVDWEQLMELYPRARFINYSQPWEVLNEELDVLDLPDAHYEFTQYFTERHPKTVVVAWDNLPGKNTMSLQAMRALGKSWKCVARSELAKATLLFDGVPEDKINLIPGAIDTEFFQPGKQKRKNAVLFVGRLTPEKGLLDLIWAMKGIPAELWVVGEGDRDYFKGWADRVGIQVRWFGKQNRHQLLELYQYAKVFVLPSVPLMNKDVNLAWLEQFGQVLIEALACGVPVVGSRSGAIPEVVYDQALVNPRDWAGLAFQIRRLLEDDWLWHRQSAIARDWAVTTYDQKVVGEAIKKWYEL